MKKISLNTFVRSRFPLALFAGLLLAASFPKIGIAGFAWIAPGLMLAIALGKNGRQSFRLGYAAGFAHYLASLYWLLNIPVTGFPILGWVALSAFLALLTGTWVWLCLKALGVNQVSGENKWIERLKEISSWSWTRRIFWTLGCAATWVALEMTIARLFGGFPWNLLGASQYRLLPLIQFSSFTGVYGVSFLIVWTSVSLLCAVATIITRPDLRSVWIGEIILPMLALVTAFTFGFHKLRQPPVAARELSVALIQPSIPQTMIWNQENDFARFQNLIQLSEQALTNHVDVLLWPEAATPSFAARDTNFFPVISQLAREHRVWIILGSDDAGRLEHPTEKEQYEYYNASFLVSPYGEFVARYRKRNLVIFGEYIPFEHTLPFIKWLTPVTGSFTPGDKAVPFEMELAERRAPVRPDSENRQLAEPARGVPI
ncbi:MAG: apolipoprotein N-acyltransferase, partial [Verrucomicrobiota bacterium]